MSIAARVCGSGDGAGGGGVSSAVHANSVPSRAPGAYEAHKPFSKRCASNSTDGRNRCKGKPTSIKTSEEVRDLATRELTAAERKERAVEAVRELGIGYTDQTQQAGQDAWSRIRSHQGDAAA
ncbi:hypothetical protein [Streptomyces canus]|uniref:hypothetical protein n=1 Tax=Streptomyces canus TaxID=58343 RepID=UPI000996B84E|nr:hypothetical protein [Streptomyces canus]